LSGVRWRDDDRATRFAFSIGGACCGACALPPRLDGVRERVVCIPIVHTRFLLPHKRPRDETQRLVNQNNQVLELNSLASGSVQKNIKIRIETTQVAVRDKEQEVGAPGI